MKSDNELILEALDSVSEWKEHGICCQVSSKLREFIGVDGWDRRVKLELQIQDAMREWGLYSGSPSYPVPDSLEKITRPYYAFNMQALWEGEYGFLRAELLNFLKEYFKNAN